MFAKLFEDRDKKISYLIKLGDCIGRSLRENVTLFSIDSQNSLVTYLTESDKVISGQYKIGKDVVLNNIDVRDSSIFEDNLGDWSTSGTILTINNEASSLELIYIFSHELLMN